MPRNLTPQFIKAMEPPATGNRVEWDDQERGLGIRITAAGHRAFVLRYVVQGRERRMTLGEYPTLSLTAARDMARGRKGDVIKGADPLAAKAAERTALTLKQAVARYVAERVPKQKARTQIETRRALETHWAALHPMPLATITRGQVAARLSELVKANGPLAANRARAQLSALYRWAIAEGLAELNAVAGTNKREEKPRELGVQPHVIEAVVNHISGHKAGVAGVYNHATYAAEKRQALDRWADHFMALVAGQPSNVVPLRRETA